MWGFCSNTILSHLMKQRRGTRRPCGFKRPLWYHFEFRQRSDCFVRVQSGRLRTESSRIKRRDEKSVERGLAGLHGHNGHEASGWRIPRPVDERIVPWCHAARNVRNVQSRNEWVHPISRAASPITLIVCSIFFRLQHFLS